MTDLYLALLALGAAIIIAVVTFNWWQERKFRNESAQRFASIDNDALMEEFDNSQVLPRAAGIKKEPSFTINDAPDASDEPEHHPEHFDNAKYDLNQPIIDEREALEAKSQAEVLDAPTPRSNIEENLAVEQTSYETDHTDQEVNLATEVVNNSVESSAVAASVPPVISPEAEHDSPITLPDDIDPLMDLIAVLYLPEAGTSLPLRDFIVALTDIDKPLFLHVLTPEQTWLPVTRESSPSGFSKVTCSLQLANRSGYISKASLSRFQAEVDKLGRSLSAHVEWQMQADPWRYASELDQFCIDVDKLVGFHIIQGSSGPFTGTKFRGLAEANGFTLDVAGNYVRLSEQGDGLYTISNHDNLPFSPEMLRTSVIHGVAFKLDIPRVKNCPEVFNQMALIGQQVANNLGANLVDDNKRPVGETQLEIVRQQLRVIHTKMVARGVVPGSASALRLFS